MKKTYLRATRLQARSHANLFNYLLQLTPRTKEHDRLWGCCEPSCVLGERAGVTTDPANMAVPIQCISKNAGEAVPGPTPLSRAQKSAWRALLCPAPPCAMHAVQKAGAHHAQQLGLSPLTCFSSFFSPLVSCPALVSVDPLFPVQERIWDSGKPVRI